MEENLQLPPPEENPETQAANQAEEANPGTQYAKQTDEVNADLKESAQLLARLLVGLAILGGEELIARLRFFQQEAEAQAELPFRARPSDDENGMDTLRYLAIGLIMRGQKTAVHGIEKGLNLLFIDKVKDFFGIGSNDPAPIPSSTSEMLSCRASSMASMPSRARY